MEVHTQEGTIIIKFINEFLTTSASEFFDTVPFRPGIPGRIIWDLTEVERFTSIHLGILVATKANLMRLQIWENHVFSKKIERVLEAAKISGIFEKHESVAEAMRYRI